MIQIINKYSKILLIGCITVGLLTACSPDNKEKSPSTTNTPTNNEATTTPTPANVNDSKLTANDVILKTEEQFNKLKSFHLDVKNITSSGEDSMTMNYSGTIIKSDPMQADLILTMEIPGEVNPPQIRTILTETTGYVLNPEDNLWVKEEREPDDGNLEDVVGKIELSEYTKSDKFKSTLNTNENNYIVNVEGKTDDGLVMTVEMTVDKTTFNLLESKVKVDINVEDRNSFVSFESKYSKFDEVTKLEVPEEALKAKEME